MLATLRSRQRHQKLMRAAHHVLNRGLLADEANVTSHDVAAWAFARHQIELTDTEAQRYLNAARVSRANTAQPSGIPPTA